MTFWVWLGELLASHGRRSYLVNGYGLWLMVGFGVAQKYGWWPIIYCGYRLDVERRT